MPALSEDLRPFSLGETVLSAVAFALGVLLLALADPLRLARDYSDMFDVLWFLPLAITPLSYVPAFLFLEVTLPRRSRQRQLGWGLVAGMTFMLVISALMKAGAVMGQTLVFDDWLGMSAMWVLALFGPFIVAWVLALLEGRFAGENSHAS